LNDIAYCKTIAVSSLKIFNWIQFISYSIWNSSYSECNTRHG